MNAQNHRVAFVVSHPIQHFCPLYKALAMDGRVSVKVFFASSAGATEYFDPGFGKRVSWQSDLLEGFDYVFLPGAPPELPTAGMVDNQDVSEALDDFDPSCIVTYGFRNPVSRRAIRWAKLRRRRTLLISDGELRQRRPWRVRVRKALTLPWFVRQIDAFLTVGNCNESYYAHYGAHSSQFFRSPFPVHEAALLQAVDQRELHRRASRQELGINVDSLIVLSVGKLAKRKSHADLVAAFSQLAADGTLTRHNLHLAIAGDGPERACLEKQTQSLSERIHLLGFVPVEELPRWYAAADVLAHPSAEDPHPLAITEAIYCGLPLIVSDRIGSVGETDDARPGRNAIEVPHGDITALANAVTELTDPKIRERMSAASREIARGRDMAASVEGVVSAVLTVTRPTAHNEAPA